MKRNRNNQRNVGKTLELGQEEVVCLIDREARQKLGLPGKEALKRIREGRGGDDYVWADLRLLAALLN